MSHIWEANCRRVRKQGYGSAEYLKRIPEIERNWAITEDHLNMACNPDEAAKHEQVLVVTASLDDTLEANKAAENSIVRNFNRFNK